MVSYEKWGEYNGKDVFLYTLENTKGMKVRIANFGCAVTGIQFKGLDIALGFDDLDALVDQTCYLGVVVGRCANRIKGARFELDGSEFTVGKNLGDNHIHGGFKGFDKVLWDVDAVAEADNSVRFSYLSQDGEEGYPGNLKTKVTYSLSEECELKIEYVAETDSPTIVNLTNHTYFNLSGHNSGTIEDQQIKIYSEYFLENDDEGVPTGTVRSVTGTPFDFRDFHKIGERIGNDDLQLKYAGGYDHNYNLEHTGDCRPRLAAEAFDEKTAIQMQVYTTMPGIQFYSGNSLNERSKGIDGVVYGRRCGFCLETQFYPDAVHHYDFPQPVLLPGQVYRHTTSYRFNDIK